MTCRLFPCHPSPRACHWTGHFFHGRRLSPPGTPSRRLPPSATRTPPHAPAAQTAVWCHAHRHMNPGIGYDPGTEIVQRNVMAKRELQMRQTGTNDTGIQSRRPTWSSLKTLPAIAEANAMPSATRLHLRCSCCACAAAVPAVSKRQRAKVCGPTFRGHREDAVRQQLEHLLQALAVRLVAPLGQVLLQVEALDRLAAGREHRRVVNA